MKKVGDCLKVVDLDNFKHGIRVANIAVKLSKEIGLNNNVVEEIYISSILHDLGKSYLDQDILYKPSKLTKEEREYIENHSYLGYKEVLKLGFSINIALNILYHHEDYDGMGYPTGLAGNNIPVGARIIKICDVFDALISDRSYRARFTIEDAIKIMDNEKEKFDNEFYAVFVKMINSNRKEEINVRV